MDFSVCGLYHRLELVYYILCTALCGLSIMTDTVRFAILSLQNGRTDVSAPLRCARGGTSSTPYPPVVERR